MQLFVKPILTTAARLKTPRKLSRSNRGVSVTNFRAPSSSSSTWCWQSSCWINYSRRQTSICTGSHTPKWYHSYLPKQCKLCTIYSCPLQRQYDRTETTSDGSDVLNWNVSVPKSSWLFSLIIIEQANAVVRDDGGACGLTGDPATLRR